MSSTIFDLGPQQFRSRTSVKYRQYGEDVLPLWIAEMDCELAPPIAARLAEAIRVGDTGYPTLDREMPNALASYAGQHWGWQIDPAQVHAVPDVGVGVTEFLRANIDPGDQVVVCSPVYPPFYIWTSQVRSTLVDVPLLRGEDSWTFDLDGLRAAFAAGARAFLLCNPANPVGRAWTRDELAAIADLAAEYDVLVVADEIHAPLALHGAEFVPYLTIGDAARERGVSVLAASKGWNVAGLKCAQIVSAGPRMDEAARRIHEHTFEASGHLGQLAAIAAYTEGHDWLTQAVAELSANRDLLGALLAEHLPEARCITPQATYLAWIDLSAYGWGDSPNRRILADARVALNAGPRFGPQTGAGCVRLNYACSPAVLTEAITRIGAMTR